MTTKHANADLLIGFANGRKLQFKDLLLPAKERDQWNPLEADNTTVWPWLLSTDSNDDRKRFEFRLAPRTIMIGGVECEAPVDGATDAYIYYTNADGMVYRAHPDNAVVEIKNRRAFATEQAAIAAYNATTKLMQQAD